MPADYFDGKQELKSPPKVSASVPRYPDPRDVMGGINLADYDIPDLLPLPDDLGDTMPPAMGIEALRAQIDVLPDLLADMMRLG